MINHFSIEYNEEVIHVEAAETYAYVLKYPDDRFLMIDRDVFGWFIEEQSGGYWTDEDISAIGELINKNEPRLTEEELNTLPK